ncbi:MAG: LUD domain-containing protein [Tannerellaceae bacterium]|jgi:L-lactate dehydrogenase complex protein LldG|nr:LUD domain-containing protein [Tannerellaceae bacterium]
MSSKEEILSRIRQTVGTGYAMPEIILPAGAVEYGDKTAQFAAVSESVGGRAVVAGKGADLNEMIRSLYPAAKTIASNIPEITLATFNPDKTGTPYELDGTELAVVRGEIGVAENGAVWIAQNVKEKALYFIAEYLVILLDAEKIVHNMHEAYRQIRLNDYGFGLFISGPSKTADIEQALVTGAHGAKGVTVILTSAV